MISLESGANVFGNLIADIQAAPDVSLRSFPNISKATIQKYMSPLSLSLTSSLTVLALGLTLLPLCLKPSQLSRSTSIVEFVISVL